MDNRHHYLILGASGFLGRHLYSRLGADRVIATYHSLPFHGGVQLDAATMRLRDTLLSGNQKLAAAFLLHGITKIDACARDPEGTARVNVDSMIQAIDDLLDAGVKPIYASTDAVFDGSRGGWTEDDRPNPILTYGKQKAAVENYLRSKPGPWIVARLSKIVGLDDDSLLGEWTRHIELGETITCATDLIFTPAAVDDVAYALAELAEHPLSGIFNVCGPGSMSRMELLETLVEEIRGYREITPHIVPCSIRDLPFLEPRPLNGSMLPHKLYGALGRSFRDMQSVCAELARSRYHRGLSDGAAPLSRKPEASP